VYAIASHGNIAFNFIEMAMHLMDFWYILGLLSERFGDGDTSHVDLDLEEVIFFCLRLYISLQDGLESTLNCNLVNMVLQFYWYLVIVDMFNHIFKLGTLICATCMGAPLCIYAWDFLNTSYHPFFLWCWINLFHTPLARFIVLCDF
jgi:hypothetical protein